MKLNENVLREELTKKGFDLIKVIAEKQNNTIDVQVNKLHPVSTEQHGSVYVPTTTRLALTLDDASGIKAIEEEPDPKATADAEQFAKTLLANNQIGGLPGASPSHPTHEIEINDKGQQVIKRRNFSAF